MTPEMRAAATYAWDHDLFGPEEVKLSAKLSRRDIYTALRDAYLAGFAAATAQNAALVAKTIAEHAGPERRARDRDVGE